MQRTDWQQPPLPCEHNTTGLCPQCVLDFAKASALTADMELKRVADSAVDVMRKLQWERDEANKRAEHWKSSHNDLLARVEGLEAILDAAREVFALHGRFGAAGDHLGNAIEAFDAKYGFSSNHKETK